MNKTIPKFLIPMLIIFAVGLYGQDQCQIANCNHVITAGDQHGHCPTCDVELNGETEFEDHCTNNEDHCPEPSGDGGSGGGPPQAGDECDLCDHVYSGDEDHHGHCPAPTCDVVLDTDEDWEEHCNDDPDHCPEPPDGDDGYEEYGEHTVGNCIAFAEGRGSYWIGDEEFAVWDDPNVDCNYLFDQIGYQPPAYMCSWTWDDGNTCGYTSDDPDDNHEHCGYTWPDGNACGHTSDDPSAYHGHCDHLWGDGNPCGASFDDEGAHQAHSHCGFTGSDGITCGHTSDDPSAFHDHCGYTFSDGNTCDASFDNQGDFDAHQHCGFTFSDGNICGWAPWENNTFHEHCDQVFPDGNPCGASFDNEGDMDAHQDDHADDGGGQSGGGCDPDGDYPTDPPGEDNPGCIDYDDCNENTVYDLSEPCYDGD